MLMHFADTNSTQALSMHTNQLQATEDSRREDMMNETRRQSREWTEMSETVLEAKKKFAGLEAQLAKLSVQLF
ncbi:putative C6 transcription factor [Colletotrichum sp. SAR 10_86]|nr:putative C6 transcription factor [Colletotrichum sp. SAR 10_86]